MVTKSDPTNNNNKGKAKLSQNKQSMTKLIR